MKSYKQPLLTIFVIFATAYILTIMGCSSSSGSAKTAATPAVNPQDQLQQQNTDAQNFTQIDPKDMRECTSDEFSTLSDWSNSLKVANDMIGAQGRSSSTWTQKRVVVQACAEAIRKCDNVQFYHKVKPCKRTRRDITRPNETVLVGAYDEARIHQRCQMTEDYLIKFNLRPDPNQGGQQTQPTPNQPVTPPPYLTPGQNEPTVDPSSLRQCSADEFNKLKSWRSDLDQANKNISRMGNQSNWKYDANAIDAALTANHSCEMLMSYHRDQPCRRDNAYTIQTLKEQCRATRAYYYNFAQRSESLIVSNARLFFNTQVVANRSFAPGQTGATLGQCVISNQSSNAISYSGQNALVTEARVYTDPENQMFVLVTQEGLKLECYGLGFSSLKTSVSEVVRLLNSKGTSISLQYDLN